MIAFRLGRLLLLAILAACATPAVAQYIDLTPPTGTLVDPGGNLNWNSRGTTLTFSQDTPITAVECKVNLAVGQTMAARIYDEASFVLLQSGTPINGTGTQAWLASPVAFTLLAGHAYRIGFYCSDGSAVFPRKNGPTVPFTVTNGTVSGVWAQAGDIFPTLLNDWAPFLRLATTTPVELQYFEVE